MINFLTPYCPNKNLGKAINAYCEQVWDDYIGIRDGDSLFLDPFWGHRILECINRYPDVDVFGVMTNRLGVLDQLYDRTISDNSDILYHQAIAKNLWAKHGSYCSPAENNFVAGVAMVFKRSAWHKHRFQDKIFTPPATFDMDFCKRVAADGGKVMVMRGVYVFHYYRFKEGLGYLNHIL